MSTLPDGFRFGVATCGFQVEDADRRLIEGLRADDRSVLA